MCKKMTLILLAFGLLALPANAMAKQCESNDDCGEDEICVSDPCPACESEDEKDCPPCDPNGECVNNTDPMDAFLEAYSCETDADCPFYFSCIEQELPCDDEPVSGHSTATPDGEDSKEGSSGSSGSAGADPAEEEGGEDDEKMEEEEWEEGEPCEPQTLQICIPEPPVCENDDDCVEHFSCEPFEEICSGSAGSMTSPCVCPDCACEEEDPDCECPPCDCPEEEVEESFEEECEVTEYRCSPEEMACETDEDCPADWICVEPPMSDEQMTLSIDCPPCECDPEDDECECPDCEEQETVVEPSENQSMCLPEGWWDYFSILFGEDFDKGGMNEEGSSDTGILDDDEGTEGGAPSAPELDDGGDEAPLEDGGNATSDDGGCVVASGAPSGTLLILLGLFLALMLPARRLRQSR